MRIWKGRIGVPDGGGAPVLYGHIGCLLGKGGPERGAALFDIDLSGLGRGGFGVPNPRVEVSGLKP